MSDVIELFELGDLQQLQNALGELNDPVYKDGKRPLHLAAIYGHVHIAQWLLHEGATVDAVDQGAHTPLHLAAKYGHSDVTQLLIQHQADVKAINRTYKLTPLHMAAKEGQKDTAELLVQSGADVNACAKDGIRPLHLCAEKGHGDVAAVLIRAGAALDARDQIGWTPLHLAIENKQDAMVTSLLRLGAHPDTPNKNGWAPLHLAASSGSVAAVRALLEHGADLTATNKAGKTPMDLAADGQQASVIPLLNPATAAKLASDRSLFSIGGISLKDSSYSAGSGASDYASIDEQLLGNLGLRDSFDAFACPFCSQNFTSNSMGLERSVSGGSSGGSDAEGLPSLFLCPLSRRVLKDPVVACDGFTYDRRAVQEFFESGQRISPLTKQPLRSTATLPNHVIKCAVNEWLEWREKRRQQVLRQQSRNSRASR